MKNNHLLPNFRIFPPRKRERTVPSRAPVSLTPLAPFQRNLRLPKGSHDSLDRPFCEHIIHLFTIIAFAKIATPVSGSFTSNLSL